MPFKLGNGKPETIQKPLVITLLPPKVDLDKLYHAVAIAESGNCSTTWHQAAKNCVSIMSWKGGKRHLKPFPSIDASRTAFETLWVKNYGDHLPTMKEAVKYTGNDKPYGWLSTVTKVYNE